MSPHRLKSSFHGRLRAVLTILPVLISLAAVATAFAQSEPATEHATSIAAEPLDYMSAIFTFMLASFIGVGVIQRVSRLLHTPLMSLTNAISAIAIVGAIMVAGSPHYPEPIRILGAIALFASMTNIVSGFLITDRMLKLFKTGARRPEASRT